MRNSFVAYHCHMAGLIAGRTASDTPGLDIAEQKSWQNFLATVLRVHKVMNRRLMDAHQLTLDDVHILALLDNSARGSARMGDLADALQSRPSRLTRQIRRLEGDGLVLRALSLDDRRGVLASITDTGRTAVQQATFTYADGVRAYFLDPLSRREITAMADNCARIGDALTPFKRSAACRLL